MALLARAFIALVLAFAVVSPALADIGGKPVLVKDIAHVQGVTGNQLVGYGVVVGLQGTGDSTSVIFTSQTIQNILQAFGLTVAQTSVRTRDVAAVIVTATLPPFAHSGDNVDVDVSSMGDATSLQGGTLVLTELKAANNLVYGTAQGPVSVGGFVAGFGGTTVNKNYTGAGRIPNGAVIARDMVTPITSSPNGFNYVLTTPDYKTAANLAALLNAHFGANTAQAQDAETVHVTLPPRYANIPVQFLADASDLSFEQDELARVVMNERTGTIVFGGDIRLAPCAIAHGDLTITIATQNQVVQPNAFSNTGQTALQRNTTVNASEKGKQLTFVAGAATLSSVVRALNALGVSPRDLIAIVQALRSAGSLQADLEIPLVASPIDPTGASSQTPAQNITDTQKKALAKLHDVATQFEGVFVEMLMNAMQETVPTQGILGDQSMAEQTWQSMLNDERSQQMAKSGQFGLAKQMESEFKDQVLEDASHEANVDVDKRIPTVSDSWDAFAGALHEESMLLKRTHETALALTQALVKNQARGILDAEKALESARSAYSSASSKRRGMQIRGFGQLTLRQVCMYAPRKMWPTLNQRLVELTTTSIGLRITNNNNKALIQSGMQRLVKITDVLQRAVGDQPKTYKRRGFIPPPSNSVLVSSKA